MKREELEAMNLTKEQIDAIMDMNGKDINSVKSKVDGAQVQLTKAQEAIAARDAQLEALKNSTGDVDQLKKQVEALQTANQEATTKYEAQMKSIRLDAAIKGMLAGKVHDEELAANLFDRNKLILNEDGTVTGLQDQLQTIQETKKFLFKGNEQPEKVAGFKFGTDPANAAGSSMDAALDAAFGLGEQ